MDQDFPIIGGGIAGVSAGAALAPCGSVARRAAEDASGSHASGRSAAHFDDSYDLPPSVAPARAPRAAHETGGLLSPRGLHPVGLPDRLAGQEETFAGDLMRMPFAALAPRRFA